MHVNDLGMRNAERVNSYRGSTLARRRTDTGVVDADTFAQQIRKALEERDKTAEAGEASGEDSGKSCCKQCELNTQLITQLMARSLYMQSGLGGLGELGLWGYSSTGAAGLAAYRSMMGVLGGSIL